MHTIYEMPSAFRRIRVILKTILWTRAKTHQNRRSTLALFERPIDRGWTQYFIVRWSTSDASGEIQILSTVKTSAYLRWALWLGLLEMGNGLPSNIPPIEFTVWRAELLGKRDAPSTNKALYGFGWKISCRSMARSEVRKYRKISPGMIAQEKSSFVYSSVSSLDAKKVDFPPGYRLIWMWFSQRLLRNSRERWQLHSQDRTEKMASSKPIADKGRPIDRKNPWFQRVFWKSAKNFETQWGGHYSRPDVLQTKRVQSGAGRDLWLKYLDGLKVWNKKVRSLGNLENLQKELGENLQDLKNFGKKIRIEEKIQFGL